MRPSVRALMVGAALASLALLLAGCETPGKLRAKQRQTEAMLQEAKAQQYELERKLAASEAEKEELRAQLSKSSQRESELEQSRKKLEESLKGTQVGVSIKGGRLVMTLLSKVFFDTGKATIKPEAKATLDKISDVIRKDFANNMAAIEGHTDNVPIRRTETLALFKTNWELSTARALAVLHYMVDEKKLPSQQFYVSGFSQYQPVADNKSAEGRSQNRRVEIAILPTPGQSQQ